MQIRRFWHTIIFSCLLIPFVNSQSRPYKVQAESVSFVSLIDTLEKVYHVQFSYPSDLLNDQVFDIKTNTSDLSSILDEISSLYDLEYQILDDKTVLLRKQLKSDHRDIQKAKKITLTIKDRSNGLPLPAAAVGISGTTIGGYTDEQGIVRFTSPRSSIIVQVHLLGYKTATASLGDVEDGEIFLDAQSFEIEEVMIQDRSNDITNSNDHKVTINTHHISALTAGVVGKDIMRQMQLLPGVASFNDASSKLKIRGGDDDGILIMMDDIPLYDASHYYGIFSSINPAYIAKTTLYKNNLPISYDGKMDGMLKIDGGSVDSFKTTTGQIDINLLNIAGAVNHSFSKDFSISFGARSSLRNASETSFSNLINGEAEAQILQEDFSLTDRNMLIATVPGFSFYDANAKLLYAWDKGSLQLSYFRSSDDLDDSYENEFNTRRGSNRVNYTEQYINSEDWQNEGVSLKIQNTFKNDLKLKSQIYKTSFNNYSTIGLSVFREDQQDNRNFSVTNARENVVDDIGFKSVLSSSGEHLNWTLGTNLISHSTLSKISNDEEIIINRDVSDLESSLFGSLSYSPSSAFLIDFGLRGTFFDENIYATPRLNLSYEICDQTKLKSSIGRHNQYVRQLSFENVFGRTIDFWNLSNRNLEVGHTDQIMIGSNHKTGRVSFDIEAYYKKRYNLFEQALLDPRFDETNIVPQQINSDNYQLFRGDGQTLGLDFLLSYTLPKYSGWISYTLSKSTISFDQILQGTPFPTQDDRRHQLNIVNEYRIENWTLGSTIVFASGRAYTDLNNLMGLSRDQLRPDERISRLPAYIRTDMSASYKFDLGDTKLNVGLSVYNLLDRSNVNYIQYIFSIPTNTPQNPDRSINALLGTESNLLRRTLNLNLSYSF